ncbi:MAG: hypothetical protein ACLP9L_23860 [Thermoguttaceae bacterium]
MRSRHRILLSVVVGYCLLNTLPSHEAEVQAKYDPVLKGIESALKALFRKEKVNPMFSWEEDSLKVSLDTQKFMVHGSFMTGEFTAKATEEVGPRSHGFVLEVERRHNDPANNQAVVPQTLHGPYWETYINALGAGTVTGKPVDYYFLRLSYGRRSDEKLRAAMEKIVADAIAAKQ